MGFRKPSAIRCSSEFSKNNLRTQTKTAEPLIPDCRSTPYSGISAIQLALVYKGQHAPNRVISVIFCVILNRRTFSTPLSSALKITEIPAVGVFES